MQEPQETDFETSIVKFVGHDMILAEIETIRTMEGAISTWRKLDGAQNMVRLLRGRVLLSVKRYVKGGLRAFCKRVDIAESTAQSYMQMVERISTSPYVSIRMETLGYTNTRMIEDVKDPVERQSICDEVENIVQERGEAPPKREVKAIIEDHKIERKRDEYLEKFGEHPPDMYRTGNYWNIEKPIPIGVFGVKGYKHGTVAAEILQLLVFYLTDIGDLVVDPMAGGGSMSGVCEHMKRRVITLDIEPIRDYIRQNDIWNGLPDDCRGAKLIYLDPPYFDMKQPVYGGDADKYFAFQDQIIDVAAQNLVVGGYVAYIIMEHSSRDEEGLRYGVGKSLIGEVYCAIKAHPLLQWDKNITAPIPYSGFRGMDVGKAKESGNLVGLNRAIWVAKKYREVVND